MAKKNKIAYILALPKILQSERNDTELVNTKLTELLDKDPDAQIYLSLVGVMFPKIENKIIEDVIQLFIENQDIVREIDKLDMDIAISITSDAGKFIKSVAGNKSLNYQDWEDWQSRCIDWKNRYSVNEGVPFSQTGIISHYKLVDTLSKVIRSIL